MIRLDVFGKVVAMAGIARSAAYRPGRGLTCRGVGDDGRAADLMAGRT